MSVITSSTTPIPAGWYPDPYAIAQQRWWDGNFWTSDTAPYAASPQHDPLEDLRANAASATIPSYGAVSAYGFVSAYDAVQPRSLAASATYANEFGAAHYQPFAMIPTVRQGVYTSPTQRFTAAVWLLAGAPLAFAVLSVLLSHGPAGISTRFSQGGVATLAIATAVLLAARDRRDLQVVGHQQTASPWWLLLTPVGYLAARAAIVRKQTGKSASSPLLIGILIVVVIVTYALTQPAAVSLVLAAGHV